MKYDRIVKMSQTKSRKKVLIAQKEIERMLMSKERITVTALVKYTGLSKGFFYQNEEVRRMVEDAQLRQGESYNPKKVIFDTVMKERIQVLKMEVLHLKQQIKILKEENEKLTEENKRLQEKN